MIGSLRALLAHLDAPAGREAGAEAAAAAGGERLRALFLDRGNGLLRDEAHGCGPADPCAAVVMAVVVRRARELAAAAVVLVRWRPEDDPVVPSAADIAASRRALAELAAAGVVLHDYVIVGRGRPRSLRGEGLIRSTP